MSGGSCFHGAVRDGSVEVADILRRHLDDYRDHHAVTAAQEAVARDITRCRTAALGGHVDVCSECRFERPSYNSCRNRHCPKCQALAQQTWVEARMRRVLPTHYFHVVFTLPSELRALARRNRDVVFELLLRTAADALLTLGRDPKWLGAPAQLGVTTVLHTWTRDLRFHPHVHCIVTGGGLSLDQTRWVGASADFIFPVAVLGALFRRKLLDGLARVRARGRLRPLPHGTERDFRRLCRRLRRKRWVVYAKRPFGGPEQVHQYLGRYTHRVAISNARILRADHDGVTFRTRGAKTTTIPPMEFVRRFFQHVLPSGFVKIRHYGLLASGNVSTRLARAASLLGTVTPSTTANEGDATQGPDDDWSTVMLALTGVDVWQCPRCRAPSLRRLPLGIDAPVQARGPPAEDVA